MWKRSRSVASSAFLIAGLGFSLFASTQAMALIHGQAQIGRRWYSFENGGKTTGAQAQEIDLAVHVDPIPLVPVSFGVGVGILELNKDDLGSGTTKAGVVEPNVQIQAWVPMVPIVTPFVRVKIPVMSKYALTNKTTVAGVESESAAVYKVSGYHLNAGVKWSPLPLVNLLFEVGMGKETAKVDELKVGGTKASTSGAKDTTVDSKSLLVGVEVGI